MTKIPSRLISSHRKKSPLEALSLNWFGLIFAPFVIGIAIFGIAVAYGSWGFYFVALPFFVAVVLVISRYYLKHHEKFIDDSKDWRHQKEATEKWIDEMKKSKEKH